MLCTRDEDLVAKAVRIVFVGNRPVTRAGGIAVLLHNPAIRCFSSHVEYHQHVRRVPKLNHQHNAHFAPSNFYADHALTNVSFFLDDHVQSAVAVFSVLLLVLLSIVCLQSW